MFILGGKQLLREGDGGRETHPDAGVDGRLAEGLGHMGFAGAVGLHHQGGRFYALLDEIVKEREAEAGCLVTAVVVRKTYPKISGRRFFDLASEMPGYDCEDKKRFHAEQLGKAIVYWRTVAQREK
jgi:hypothetical protein